MLAFLLAIFSILIVGSGFKFLSQQYALRRFSTSHGCKEPPYEDNHDLLGLGIFKIFTSMQHIRRKTVLPYFVESFNKYGETYCSRIMGSNVVFTCNPRNMKEILATSFSDYGISTLRARMRYITAHGILAVDGPEWKTTRKTFVKQFIHTSSILDLDLQERKFQRFLSTLPSSGQTLNIKPLLSDLMKDVHLAFTLGESLTSPDPDTQSDERNNFIQAISYIDHIIAGGGPLGSLTLLPQRKKYNRECRIAQAYVDKLIAHSLEARNQHHKQQQRLKPVPESGSASYNMLDSLASNMESIDQLRDDVLTSILAGIESVTSLLSSTFYLLARDERVFSKLRATIQDAIGEEKPPTYDQIKSLTYLAHVLNETLRLYPPAPLNGRIATKDTILPTGGGPQRTSPILIRKGQLVIYSAWASHYNKRLFGADADIFRPERWENRDETSFINSEAMMGYIPFSTGARVCPGQRYALMEASYIVIRMLQTFAKIENRDHGPWVEKLGTSLFNDNGVLIGLYRRKDGGGD